MSWNYRLMKHISEKGEEWYGVHEVFYTEKGKIFQWTMYPIDIPGDNLEEILESIEHIKKDITNQSVLDYNMEPEGSLEDDCDEEDLCPKCKSVELVYTREYQYLECLNCGYIEHPREEDFLP